MTTKISEPTPGPWTQHGATKIVSWGHGAVAIVAMARIGGTTNMIREADPTDDAWDEAMANARVIAAAPDLLDALKDILSSCPCDWDITTEFLAAYEKSKAAIAKAEGR